MNMLYAYFSLWKQFSLARFSGSLLQAFGVLWLLVETIAFFSKPFASQAQSLWWIFLITGIVIGIIRARPRTRINSRVEGTDTTVEIRICNIFQLSGAIIIGSNTTFDTSVEDNTISKQSLQGQYTSRFCTSVVQLDRDLTNALSEIHPVKQREDKTYGKRDEYELGTVAPLDCGGRRAYFVAVATLNAHHVASATRQNVLDALPKIWEHIRTRGGIEPLCCPILGSGFARVKAKREELICEIVKSFVAANQAGKFCEKLTIAISPKDFHEANINLIRLGRFLEHECTYARSFESNQNNTPTGTPLSR